MEIYCSSSLRRASGRARMMDGCFQGSRYKTASTNIVKLIYYSLHLGVQLFVHEFILPASLMKARMSSKNVKLLFETTRMGN